MGGIDTFNHTDAPDASVQVDWTGRQIGRYLIQKSLGRGGIATVYQAYDTVQGISVALKVLAPGGDAKVINRFRREAMTAASLRHPHIVRTLQVSIAPQSDIAYIAMELVEGEDLAAFLAKRRRLTPEEAATLLVPVARALHYAHQKGVIHRDVKPSNILLRTSSAGSAHVIYLDSLDYPITPLLSDFGIARGLDAPELTNQGRTVGTPAFMAPEQCTGRRTVDGRADIYALGAVFYRCIAGRLPFNGTTTQILHAHVYDPITLDDDLMRLLSPMHIQILQRSLAKSPADRYQQAEDLAADFVVGARQAALDAPAYPQEHHQTVTLQMMALPERTAGPVTVLVPSPIKRTATTTTAPSVDEPESENVLIYRPDIGAIERRLERWAGPFLSIMLTIITVWVILALWGVSLSDLYKEATQLLAPIPTVPAQPPETSPSSQQGGNQMAGLRINSATLLTSMPTVALFTASLSTATRPTAAPTLSLDVVILPTEPPMLTPTPSPIPTLPSTPTLPEPTSTPEAILSSCTTVIDESLRAYVTTQLAPELRMGFLCPLDPAVNTAGELLYFEHGYMMKFADNTGIYFYLNATEEWEDVNIPWTADEPELPPIDGITVTPEDGLFVPKRQWGKVWQQAQMRVALGFARMPEPLPFTAIRQKFPEGILVVDVSGSNVYLFLKGKRRL